MGYDERMVERVRRVLSGREDATEQRMVGGWAFLVGGSLCCGVTGAALTVRVGSEGREWALAQPHARPMVFDGRELAGFVCVDPEGIASDAALSGWVQRRVDYAASLPEKPTKARSGQRRGEGKEREQNSASFMAIQGIAASLAESGGG